MMTTWWKEILEVNIHPKYNTQSSYFDLALIKMKHVDYTSRIRPICLPTKGKFEESKYDNYGATVTGWGVYSNSGKPASKLNVASVTIYDNR